MLGGAMGAQKNRQNHIWTSQDEKDMSEAFDSTPNLAISKFKKYLQDNFYESQT